MRTSVSQFEALIEFMEQHGDLNKPADGPQGRVRLAQLWAQLTERLNLDVTGDSKPLEKWKKVWSDYKNNTKRKAAKIHISATGTGGGPASRLFLSDLEQRVLQIIGLQSATGLIEVQEVGVVQSTSTTVVAGPSSATSVLEEPAQHSLSDIQLVLEPHPSPSDVAMSMPVEDTAESLNASPEPVRRSPHRSRGIGRRSVPRLISTPQRARRITPRRVARTSHSHETATRFEEQDQRWRLIFQEIANEHFRLRERELAQQERLRQREQDQQALWQNLARQCLEVLSQFLNK